MTYSKPTMPEETLWAVNIIGPDDLIAVANYVAAVRIASAFNDWWRQRITEKPLTENHPRLWACPIPWPHDDASHDRGVSDPPEDYKKFIQIPPAPQGEKGWTKQVEKALLEAWQRQYIADGMKIEQAKIHAEMRLNEGRIAHTTAGRASGKGDG